MSGVSTMKSTVIQVKDLASVLAIALIASLLTFGAPFAPEEAQGAYTSHVTYTSDSAIVFNNAICELGNPAQHLTAGSAFAISTPAQLWETTDCVSESAKVYFELTGNINIAGTPTAPTSSPIGYSSSPSANASFSGVLDGKNFSITNIAISTSQNLAYGVGLFAAADSATFLNLTIGGNVTYSGTDADVRTAGLVAKATGGITISNVISLVNVTGQQRVGGLVGKVESGNALLANVRNAGDILAREHYAAGFIGEVEENVSVSSSINQGAITASSQTSEFGAGMVGAVRASAEFATSVNSGTVFAASYAGGLLGYAALNVTVASSANQGAVTGLSQNTAGLIGSLDGSLLLSFSTNSAMISGGDQTAGLVGSVNQSATISSCTNTGAVSGVSYVGGLIAKVNNDLEITNSWNQATISGTGLAAGGLFGLGFGTKVTQSRNEGAVYGYEVVGGMGGAVNDAQILNSYNAAAVDGSLETVGGLIGSSNNSTKVENSFNVATVSGGTKVGGLVGTIRARVDIARSYNSGIVSSSGIVDGVLARTESISGGPGRPRILLITISNVVTAVQSSYSSTSTIAQLKQASGFPSFDFTNVWMFSLCGENDGLPILRGFGRSAVFAYVGCDSSAPATNTSTAANPYNGPILTQPIAAAIVGTKVVLTGKRLSGVASLKVGDVAQVITSLTDTAISFTVDSKTVLGVNDIVLVDGTYGKLTVISAILIALPTVYVSSESPVIQDPNSKVGTTRVLSKYVDIRNSWFDRNVKDSGIYNVVCTAAVAPGTTMYRKIQAKKLAIASCAKARDYLGNSLRVQAKETDLEFLHGRVLITFNG